MVTADAVLDVRGLSSGYPSLPVLFDVSFDVRPGELVTVLGGNGAGKSTLLKTILGDVRASSGEIVFDGRRLTAMSLQQRVAVGISYCPEGRRVFPNLTVRENLLCGTGGFPRGQVSSRFAPVFELFPLLEERKGQRAGTLSGGEQQMLAIGRALMPNPRLLLVEEVSLGLAPIVVSALYRALRKLCDQGLAVLISEQFQQFRPEYGDRWLVLERGTVVATGGKEEAHALSPRP